MSKLPVLVVFDIDETLIQFIPKNAYHYWEETSDEDKKIIKEKCGYIDYPKNRTCMIFRTGLREFLEEVKKNDRIKIALWTYSERDYCNGIAEEITNYFGFEENPFVFQYAYEDMKDETYPKNLRDIWNDERFGDKYNMFNTFLVDDRKYNICHEMNMNNGIIIQPFAPYGESKQRTAITHESLMESLRDNVLQKVLEICNNILEDIDGCSEEEIQEALDAEPVFAPKCLKRKGLKEYLREYEHEDDSVYICSIGDIKQKGGKDYKMSNNSIKSRKSRKSKNKKIKSRRSASARHSDFRPLSEREFLARSRLHF
jgi:hypothetical protein